VKVNDLKRPKLEEGFIDNFIAKVQNMAGGDGPTGVLRAMRGQDAALNKFADVIANETTPKVTERLGNQVAGIDDGSAPTPIGMILKQAELIGSLLAKKENIDISPADIQSAIATNKDDILKMLLVSDDSVDAIVKSIFQAVVMRSPSVRLRNSLNASIRTVSLIVAGTIIYIKTTKEDLGDFVIDPADLQKFDAAGEQVKEILLDPTSPEIRALNPNEDFKDHLHWLIIQMISAIQKKYAVLDNAQLQQLLATPPALLSPIEFKSALSGHATNVDPNAVNQLIQKATPAIQAQFKAWLEIAVKETEGGRPANESAHLYVDPWGANAMRLVDNMKFTAAPAKAEAPADTTIEPAGKPIAPAGAAEVVKIGNQEIKPNDPLYDRIMAAVNGTEK
jgi:hypothetical protein